MFMSSFEGEGHTVQAARHNAASKALHELKQLPTPGDTETPNGGVGAGIVQCPGNSNVPTNDVSTNGNGIPDLSTELKSPISLVHEIALKRNLNVIFEVLSEKGPPHMKVNYFIICSYLFTEFEQHNYIFALVVNLQVFVTVCRVGDLVAEGEGNGKKISKKRAAEKMLEELGKLPPLPYMNNLTPRLKRKRIVTKKKIRNLIKVNQVSIINMKMILFLH